MSVEPDTMPGGTGPCAARKNVFQHVYGFIWRQMFQGYPQIHLLPAKNANGFKEFQWTHAAGPGLCSRCETDTHFVSSKEMTCDA